MDLTTFKEWLLINGSAHASADTHCDKVAAFFRQYEAVTQENLNSFLASKIDKWTGSSFNLFINAIKHYKKFLKIELELPKYHRVNTKLKGYITEKEANEIIAKIPVIFDKSDKIQAIVMVLFSTGIRPKELIQLKREDFNYTDKIISIKNTKTYQDRTVALSNELCKMLPAIFNQEAEQSNAFNISHHHLTYIFQRINEVMGLKVTLTPYSMRHSYAHNLDDKGINTNSLQLGMGHKNIKTTLGYTRVSGKKAQDEIRKLINKRRKK